MSWANRSRVREIVDLAWPIAAGMLGETALGLVDTKLVGGLGSAAVAGVGMGWTLLFLVQALVFGLMRGVKVRTAYATGQGRHEDAIRYGEAGVILGALIGVAVWIVAQDLTTILVWLRVDPATIPYADAFVKARAWGAIGTSAGAALIQYRQGLGDSRTPMIVGLGGNLVNAALAYALIYGKFGFPALGVRGAGYGTAITEVLELAVLVALLFRGRPRPALSLRHALSEVLSLGVPTGLHFALEAAAFTLFTTVLGSMGAAELAAHHIALMTIRVSFLPGAAVAEAASVLVARALARRDLEEADGVTRSSLLLGIGFMSLCGVLFAVFGGAIGRAFASEPEVVSITRNLLLIAAVFQTLDAVNMILRGALRGAKDVRWVAVVGTAIMWICLPGSALVLGRHAGLGAVGGWIGFVFETTTASALLWLRWSRGAWRAEIGGPPRGAPAEALAPIAAS